MFRGTRDNRVFILNLNLHARSYKNIKFKFGSNVTEVKIWQARRNLLCKIQKMCKYNLF